MDVLLVSTKKQSMPSAKELDRKKVIKDRLTDVEESLDNIARSGLAQGCSGLLVGRNNVREIARTLDLHRIPQRIHILNIHDNRSRRRHSVIIFAHELEPLTRQLRD
ncbi:crn domain-containing protein-containing protein [Plasmopara halstedii]|uniref:Crn domain-containing protein-containing protein n=1 Tax=Plasmopara halstedii TaxID=4781 RepID=A0A0P1AL52_PLAHL|nr:crn domain-containing protein-containing protein [Plasmopara halstedii]CEG41789.1 crn domain-containing protein-containing protein [Plasmopara halstedii]|eukprot:XP_024578158.1 crn domain-containing protein-containing protein [Plasmopara halstedii]